MPKLMVWCVLLMMLVMPVARAEAQTVGWRGDGTGVYPQARPTTRWSATQPVAWFTPTAQWGNATPIGVGERVFLGMEPTTLLCLNLADGKVLWEKSVAYTDVMTAEEQAQAREQAKVADGLLAQIREMEKPLNEARAQQRKAPNDAALKERVADLEKQKKVLDGQLAEVSKWRLPETHPTNGYSSPTPTSDGQHVWMQFGSGLVACYDLEGKPQWTRLIEKSKNGWGHSSSPLLAGGRLIVQYNETMWALNPATGEEIWKTKITSRWGSPVRARVGELDLIITPNGDIVRVTDGKVLKGGLSGLEYNAPLVNGDVVYFIQTDSKAYRLAPEGADGVTATPLWQASLKKERYYASPVLHEGLLYAINQQSVLSVVDAANGQVRYERDLKAKPSATQPAARLGDGTVYPSIVSAGDVVLVSCDNGTTIVLKPGRTFDPIAQNALPPFRSTPVFAGNRMLVRTLTGLYCIGQ